MTIAILITVGSVLFMVGSLFVLKGYQQDMEDESSEEDPDVVPISDPVELDELKEQYSTDQPQEQVKESVLPKQEESLGSDTMKEEGLEISLSNTTAAAEGQFAEMQKQVEQLKEQINENEQISQRRINDLLDEKRQVEDALERELRNKETVDVSEDEREQWKEKEKKLAEAENNVVQLNTDNQRMNEQIQEQTDKIAELNKEIDFLKNNKEQAESTEQVKLEALQVELEKQKVMVQEAHQADLVSINKLKTENEELMKEESQYKERIGALELKIKEMHNKFLDEVAKQREQQNVENTDNSSELNQRLEESLKKNQAIEEQILYIKSSYEHKINELNDQINSLNQKTEMSANDSAETASVEGAGESLKAVENEKQQLLSEKEDLTKSFEKLKEFNKHLLEKEKVLIYELSKSRAQSLGLEKICEDFKRQADQKDQSDPAAKIDNS